MEHAPDRSRCVATSSGVQETAGGPRGDWVRRMAGRKMGAALRSVSEGSAGAAIASDGGAAQAVAAPAENMQAGW